MNHNQVIGLLLGNLTPAQVKLITVPAEIVIDYNRYRNLPASSDLLCGKQIVVLGESKNPMFDNLTDVYYLHVYGTLKFGVAQFTFGDDGFEFYDEFDLQFGDLPLAALTFSDVRDYITIMACRFSEAVDRLANDIVESRDRLELQKLIYLDTTLPEKLGKLTLASSACLLCHGALTQLKLSS